MNAQDILKQYEGLRRSMPDAKLPALEADAYQLVVTPHSMDTVEKVYAALDRFNPVTGWIGYQSGNQHFNNQPLEIKADYGQLLNAEVTNGNGASLHVRYNGNGGWVVTEYRYSAGNAYLADKVRHVASFDKDGNTTLQYLRFWQEKDGALGVNPVFACFVGFGGKA
ncbi:hypothetical protein [Thiothrix fructosivorans]|uniref:Uncharacterized protein n=1 Tax=Thiothrix fructosivorans TaxID=111770 RepID=A0A8B0SNK7_9GAMM|nr:hypothetical protein [Thiothrix fructosivorans]MBO0613276.1 hypothetical protein [Thiothrix fructosivorans]QTX11287.1 hypothetical protein J1836_002710 [Thiothrix fructosivorans]